jgi:hypothetical protein
MEEDYFRIVQLLHLHFVLMLFDHHSTREIFNYLIRILFHILDRQDGNFDPVQHEFEIPKNSVLNYDLSLNMNFFYHLENPIQIVREKNLKEKQIDLLFTKKVHKPLNVVAKETRVIAVYRKCSVYYYLDRGNTYPIKRRTRV